jgi:hypothetical protein
MHPHLNDRINVIFWVEIWSPLIEIHPLSAYKVRSTAKDQISVHFLFKQKHKEPPATERVREMPFYQGFPIFINLEGHNSQGWTRTLGISCSFLTNM